MAQLVPENQKRKLDSLGRITIPKGLRDRLFINNDDEFEFYTINEGGKTYICLEVVDGIDPKYYAAKSVLEELGDEIPEGLANKISGVN